MAYVLHAVTIRANRAAEGMKRVEELWRDVAEGKLPLLFNSEGVFQQGVSPVSRYSGYETDDTGDYDLSILGVTSDFFGQMEQKVWNGLYQKYDAADEDGDLDACARKAWERVWSDQKSGRIRRAFSTDYESAVPAEYTKDRKAHCYLYIAVQP